MKKLLIGAVADDFTGASDAASFLAAAGIPTVLYNGVPKTPGESAKEAEAAVVALKTRTMPNTQAVEESMEAFRWLKHAGAGQLYLKYCSTFDSTPEGNIGPVADAVMDEYQIPYTVLCPSLPVNGRKVKDGKLYVNGVLLEDSPMKDHPLTPMRESSIPRLMEPQSKYPVFPVKLEKIGYRPEERCYLVPDYYEDSHGDRIAESYMDLPFLTGGSGLLGALGRQLRKKEQKVEGKAEKFLYPESEGKALLIAGSCSAITLKQIGDYRKKGYPCLEINPIAVLSDPGEEERIWKWVCETGSGGLIYSSAEPEKLKESQKIGKELAAETLEQLFSRLAVRAMKNGCERIIVAGGETSGAVTRALGYQAFHIGESVATGVPVMVPVTNPKLRLVLKSGNFGTEDFFERALRMTGREV